MLEINVQISAFYVMLKHSSFFSWTSLIISAKYAPLSKWLSTDSDLKSILTCSYVS